MPIGSPYDKVRAVEWEGRALRLLDQRLLPHSQTFLMLDSARATAQAISDMAVRGAPAIGIAAAYGVVLAARDRYRLSPHTWKRDIAQDLDLLRAARPTAVNLAWALARMRARIDAVEGDPVAHLLQEAEAIHAEDVRGNRRMGELGAALLGEPGGVLTHCNTGSLATGGYGTALGVVRSAYAQARITQVYADETRPWLQGARLTAWELVQDRIPVTLIADSAAAHLMRQGKVRWVIVGADRIAANGDTANKIGTYSLAIAARYHGVKFMVVAPTATIDPALASGAQIPIECRGADEVLRLGLQRIAADDAQAWNPAFDVTPAALIDAIVTEKGVIVAPTAEKIADLLSLPSQR